MKYLVRKTSGATVTLAVEAKSETEAEQRARAGDGEIIQGPENFYRVIGPDLNSSENADLTRKQ